MAETTKKQQQRTIDLATEELRSFAERINQVVDDHDVDALMEMCANDIILTWLPVGTYNGKGEVREQWEELFTAFPDFARDAEIIALDKDTIVMRSVATGTFSGGPFAGYEPTGAAGQVRVMDVNHLKNGKIHRMESYWDGLEMARSLGVMPGEGSVADRVARSATNAITKARHLRKREEG